MKPYAEALDQLHSDAEHIAQWTRDRLDLRGKDSRELSEHNREQLVETAASLEDTAATLRHLAEPRAALNRYVDRLAMRLTS